MLLRRLALSVLVAAPIACAGPKRAPELPLAIASDHFLGTLWTGPIASEPPGAAAEPWWFELSIAYANAPPSTGNEPLSTHVDQVFVERVGRPIDTRGELARGALAIDRSPAAVGDFPVLRERKPVWAGTTTVWRAAPRRRDLDPSPKWDAAQIDLSRTAEEGKPVFALVLEGVVVPRAGEESSASPSPAAAAAPAAPVRQKEHLVLASEPFASGGRVRIFLPAPRKMSPRGGYALEIARVDPPEGNELAEALASGRTALERSSARARGVASAPTADESFRFESGTALPALESPTLRRPALAFLATVARAPLAGDLALDAGPEALASYAASLVPVVRGEGLDEATSPTLGWALERSAFVWLAGAALDEKRPLEPELSAILLARAGELGRFPELLRDAVLECDGLEALERRLVQENRIFLEDADAGARLRAFDWLGGRGAAPDGFDPLGPLPERRAALDRMRASLEAAK